VPAAHHYAEIRANPKKRGALIGASVSSTAAAFMVCNPRHRPSARFRDTVVGALGACSS
jgi:hypothetical protein